MVLSRTPYGGAQKNLSWWAAANRNKTPGVARQIPRDALKVYASAINSLDLRYLLLVKSKRNIRKLSWFFSWMLIVDEALDS